MHDSFLSSAGDKNNKDQATKDLSLGMYIALTTGLFLWFIYGSVTKNLPIIIANAITLLFASIILVLKIKYK